MPAKAIFKGQVFAISGKLSQPRKDHEELIRKYGGEVANSVTAAVTYLISTEDDVKNCSSKVASAQGRGVPIVQEGYLGACVAAKKLLDSGYFVVKSSKTKKRKVAPKAEAAAAAPAAKRAKAAEGAVTTTDKVEVIAKSGLADKAKVVLEETAKGFVKATLTWDVELVLNDLAAGKDKYYNMQFLANAEGSQFWAVQHWGKTGMGGTVHVDGPFDSIAAGKKVFRKKYRAKTGNVFGQVGATFVDIPGKYRPLAKEEEEEEAAPGAPRRVKEGPGKWQYYLHNKVDGKKLGWYEYDEDAAENMEKYWGQFQRDAGLNVRLIQSDYFKYEVNFSDMIQRNTTSGMRRVIRRIAAGERPDNAPPEKIPEKAAPDAKPAESSDEEDEDMATADEDEPEEDGAAEEAEEEAAADEDEGEAAAEEGEEPAAPAAAAGGRAPPPAAPAGGRAPPPAAAAAAEVDDNPAAPAGGRAPPPAAAAAGGRAPPPAKALPMRGAA